MSSRRSANVSAASALDKQPPQTGAPQLRARVLPRLPAAVIRSPRRRRVSTGPMEQGEHLVAPSGNRSAAYLAAKRACDLVGAAALLVLFSPLLLATLAVLTMTTRWRPIFCQERIGYCGRKFRMYKFRTMVLGAEGLRDQVANEQDGPVFKNRRDPRITRVGRLLRTTSIDEMPQLVNVLMGRMSLVGPRPALAREVAGYEPWQRRRLAVKPGLTCLWQVAGRSEIGFDEWVAMDVWYVENQGLWTDLKLLLRTPWSVLSARGAY